MVIEIYYYMFMIYISGKMITADPIINVML